MKLVHIRGAFSRFQTRAMKKKIHFDAPGRDIACNELFNFPKTKWNGELWDKEISLF